MPRDLTALARYQFPLGEVIDPQSGRGNPAGLMWTELGHHVAVIGPSGSGKSSNIFVPWVVTAIRNGYSVVTLDTRGDFLAQVTQHVNRSGATGVQVPVYYWDVLDANSRQWNPLSEVSGHQSVSQAVSAILGDVDPADPQRYFAERDHRWLRGLITLVLAIKPDATPSLLYGLTVNQQALTSAAAAAPAAAAELLDLLQFRVDEYARATSGLANRLSWFTERTAARASAQSDFSLNEVCDNGGLFVIGARLSGGEPARAAAALALNLLRLRILERFGRTSRPMLWMLDEAASFDDRIDLSSTLDVVRAADVGIVLGLQDVAQLGDDSARSRLLANCATLIVLRGSSADSANFASARLGAHDLGTTTTTLDRRGLPVPTAGRERVPVLGAREIMFPPNLAFGGVVHNARIDSRPFLVRFA